MNLVDLFWHIALGQARKCRLWLVLASVEKPLIQGHFLAYSLENAKTKPSSEKKRWLSHFGPFRHLLLERAAGRRNL